MNELGLRTDYQSGDPLHKVTRAEEVCTVHRFLEQLEVVGGEIIRHRGGWYPKIVLGESSLYSLLSRGTPFASVPASSSISLDFGSAQNAFALVNGTAIQFNDKAIGRWRVSMMAGGLYTPSAATADEWSGAYTQWTGVSGDNCRQSVFYFNTSAGTSGELQLQFHMEGFIDITGAVEISCECYNDFTQDPIDIETTQIMLVRLGPVPRPTTFTA